MWNEFSPFDPDDDSGAINDGWPNFYRLWGAGNPPELRGRGAVIVISKVRDALLEGRFIVEQSPQYVVRDDLNESSPV